jgi:RNA-binding protein YlmH
MLSAVFNVSRGDASEAISRGMVFVNDTEASKPDMRISEGDKLVLRGKGKAYFREQGGTTRKGRLSVLFEKYI